MFAQPNFIPLTTLKTVLCDGAYIGHFAEKIKYFTGAEVQVAKRSELHKFAVIPKRCVGLLNALLVDWINVADFGKTVNAFDNTFNLATK